MVKTCALSKAASDSLGRIRPTRGKGNTNGTTLRRPRTKQSWRKKSTNSLLSGQPPRDTFESKAASLANSKKSHKVQSTNIGDVYRLSKMKYAMQYLKDLSAVAQEIPEASFFLDLNNEHVVKSIKSMLIKLTKRSEKFQERGYKEVIRDEIRARLFLPDADKNYQKVIDAMEKRHYKVADTMAEDSNGNLILDGSEKPIYVKDIDVRFGDKAQPSGYQDVQIRFEKGKELFELILMPGPNYMKAAEEEHAIFDIFKLYDSRGITKDIGAKQIVSAIREQFGIVTRKLYSAAEQRDKSGSAQIKEAVTFSTEGIKTLNGLFGSLKKLYFGKYKALPPSKRTAPQFKETQTYRNLNTIEHNLRKIMDLYKPIENK